MLPGLRRRRRCSSPLESRTGTSHRRLTGARDGRHLSKQAPSARATNSSLALADQFDVVIDIDEARVLELLERTARWERRELSEPLSHAV